MIRTHQYNMVVTIYTVLISVFGCVYCSADTDVLRELSELEKIVIQITQENGRLKNELDLMKNEFRQAKDKQEKYESMTFRKIDKLESQCLCEDKVNRRIVPPSQETTSTPVSQSVAFFAVTTDHQEHLGLQQTIQFQKPITNVGNGWDNQTSVFLAPIGGLYYFSANLMSHHNENFESELVKNGSPVVYAFHGNGDTYGEGTLSAVLQLDVGDHVWIRIVKGTAYNTGNVRVYGGAWSWFSGFMIS